LDEDASMSNPARPTAPSSGPGWSSRLWLVLIVIAVVLGFFLFTEHRAHLFGLLPYGLVLLCPLMHLFMHGRHGGHDHGGKPGPSGTGATS
jgi:hypothetical protein